MKIEDSIRPLAIVAAGGVAAWLVARTTLRSMRRMEFDGRTALVTGASRGLGLTLARKLVDLGARVAIAARDEAELERARVDLVARGGQVHAIVCDVGDESQATAMVAETERAFGPVDLLINNAGTISVGPIETQTTEDFRRSLATHFWGPYYASQAVLPRMRARRSGRIVNISSIGGLLPAPHMAAYVTGKYALVGYSKALRNEVARDGVYVTTVCPGMMRTGSPVNARFSGNARGEYAWFSVFDSLPFLSVSAESAADRILQAARFAEAEAVISVPAKLGAAAEAIAPELMSEAMSYVNRSLPNAGADPDRNVRGAECRSFVSESILTTLSRQAAARNNELKS